MIFCCSVSRLTIRPSDFFPVTLGLGKIKNGLKFSLSTKSTIKNKRHYKWEALYLEVEIKRGKTFP